jgi:hypothetical protein
MIGINADITAAERSHYELAPEAAYFSGSFSNFALHPAEQK